MTLFDSSSRLAYKRAVYAILGTTSPCRSQLRELGHKASEKVSRVKHWGGDYLYTLLHPERYPKYGINPELLTALMEIAGIDPEESKKGMRTRGRTNSETTYQTDHQSIENGIRGIGVETKKNREGNQKLLKRRITEGRGQGTGSEYSSWVHIQDVPSKGLSHRIFGYKTQREHHLLSNLELNYFLMTEWDPSVTDLREQFPLMPIEETISIAEKLQIKHPTNPASQCPCVMTTDLLITIQCGLKEKLFARSIKYSVDLQNHRVLEKLELERQYWLKRQIDWAIVTERDIPTAYIENIKLLREYLEIDDRIVITSENEEEIEGVLRTVAEEMPLRYGCNLCDKRFGYKRGTSLGLAYHFMATRKWPVDMKKPIEPDRQIAFISDTNT